MSTTWIDHLLATAVSNTVLACGLAALALLATRWCRNPAVAHGLWILVLLKLVTPPLWEVAIPLPSLAAPAAVGDTPSVFVLPDVLELSLASPDPEPGADRTDRGPAAAMPPEVSIAGFAAGEPIAWSRFAVVVWLGGSLLILAVSLLRAFRFHRRLRFARPPTPAMRREVRTLSRRLGLRRTPQVRVLPLRMAPMLWGFFGRAQVLLPEALERSLRPDQKRTLLAHEFAHFQRRDHWVRVLELVVRAVHWWNPLAIWACRRLREAEEECCDAWVLWALPDATRSYADALLDTVEFLSDAPDLTPAPASGIGRVTNLKRRLIMIMQGDQRRSLSILGRAAFLGLAALTLPLVPAVAQEGGVEIELRDVTNSERRSDQKQKPDRIPRALRNAIRLLRENKKNEDAQVLQRMLTEIVQNPRATRDLAAVRHKDRAAQLEDVTNKERTLAKLNRDYADARRQAMLLQQERVARRAEQEASRARDYNARGDGGRSGDRRTNSSPRRNFNQARDAARVEALEARVEALTSAVERLLRQRSGDANPQPDRRGRTERKRERYEEVEETEITETEEVEEVEIAEEEEVEFEATRKNERERRRAVERELRKRK